MPTAQEIACHFSHDHARILTLLDFSNMMLGPVSKTHFEHILIDCPENGPSLTKTYKFFEAKMINFDFFQNFDK